MTGVPWLVAAVLLAAATVAAWPTGRRPARRLRKLARQRQSGKRADAATPASRSWPPTWRSTALLARRWPPLAWVLGSPRRTLLATGVAGAVVGAAVGGPVAGAAFAAYGGLAVRALLRGRAGRAARTLRQRQLDGLSALAADLRAGRPGSEVSSATGDDRISRLVRAAGRLAEQTGAPLADLLDRVEADARASDRGVAAAVAQAAGARATAWLLAGLPAGGIALGYGIGVDPLAVLLHTPLGAASAVGAVILQVTGLIWADRLTSGVGRGG